MAKLNQAQKQVVALIKSDIIHIPSSKESLISLLEQFASYGDSTNDSQAEPEKGIEHIKSWMIKRLSVDRRDCMQGWRHKSTIRGQIQRTKFFKEVQRDLDVSGRDLFDSALEMLAHKIEVSDDGKQIRLIGG